MRGGVLFTTWHIVPGRGYPTNPLPNADLGKTADASHRSWLAILASRVHSSSLAYQSLCFQLGGHCKTSSAAVQTQWPGPQHRQLSSAIRLGVGQHLFRCLEPTSTWPSARGAELRNLQSKLYPIRQPTATREWESIIAVHEKAGNGVHHR